MTDDVVAELDRYINDDETVGYMEMMQRARDEIMRLRGHADGYETFPSVLECQELCRKARDEALEEAARMCETHDPSHIRNCAAAIRALKDKA